MNTHIINFCIKSIFIFLFCFFINSVNLFAVKQYGEQNSKSLNHKIIKSSNSAECQNIKPGEIPVGLNASSWERIQKQIRKQKSITVGTNKKFKNSKIQNLKYKKFPLLFSVRKLC